ncbi:transcription factor mef2A isoform X2 [Drosophila suzukii]|uniref:Transcription factor mef2A isoform X2 n=1 Tax=Drosophila suzukii TaxID=28584 RepID=A0AB40DEV5_DROSZ
MCTEVNSAMGLQATAATKRKHELTFDSKDANTTYTGNCAPPPVKANKWAISNNNYLESLEEQQQQQQQQQSEPAVESNNNHIVLEASMDAMKPTEPSISNGHEVTTAVATLKSQAEVPLPPTASAAIPEDSIARLEVVTSAVPCEPWTTAAGNGSSTPSAVSVSNGSSAEPVDCISKLQAVAVPSDPWGSIATRSTLATTLLSADELDDDDDDFEDDYEEEESIIPTYCPMRFHPFVPHPHPHQLAPHPHQQQQQQQQQLSQQQPHPQQQQQLAQQQQQHPQQQRSYAPGYGSRQPNYYSEPFPQQNCSRTGGPQHMTQSPPTPQQARGFAPPQWATAGGSPTNPSVGGAQQFYEATNGGAYAPPAAPQQTIRCAENGKSYLDLGCSSGASGNAGGSPISPPPSSAPVVPFAGLPLHGLPLKRCCDGRPGGWCSANRSCYKDTRLKIRNLSMFKLSRFRQVSEQSLYRSVLICNTLKRIDREIEAEAKELHQAAQQHHQQAAAAAAAQAAQYHPAYQQQQQQQQQSPPAPLHPHPQQQQQMDYAPVLNCARLANMDHYQQLSFQPQQQQQQQQQPPQPHGYHERLEPAYRGVAAGAGVGVGVGGFTTQPSNCDTSASGASSNTSGGNSNNSSATTASGSSSLHPYDHYPFRESQSGRATPFPACPTTTAAAAAVSGGATPTLSNNSNSSNISSSPATSSSSISISNTSSSTPMSSSSGNTASSSVVSSTSVAPAASNNNCDTSDSGYADDDSTRSINWSSVLSLSSQSALDPLNNNDLFSILPAAATPTAVPVSVPAASSSSSSSGSTLAFSGSFTTVQASSGNSSSSCGSSSSSSSSTTATFTTLSTISSATHSLTSSYVSSISSNVSAGANTWEYGFLDMEFGLGSEFTELVPSCKLSSEDLFKSGLGGQVVAASRLHDNELEQPAHIMVGS